MSGLFPQALYKGLWKKLQFQLLDFFIDRYLEMRTRVIFDQKPLGHQNAAFCANRHF